MCFDDGEEIIVSGKLEIYSTAREKCHKANHVNHGYYNAVKTPITYSHSEISSSNHHIASSYINIFMTFITAVAGPSRLPWRVATPVMTAGRRLASTDAATPSTESQANDADPEVVAELDDKGSRLARQREKLFYGTVEGYKSWLKTGAANEFYKANTGSRARWLGGDVVRLTARSYESC